MSRITSEILAKVAPGTPHAKRDRFLADFNSVLPKYGITTELRVAAFLTTVCFESDYFKALAEYADGWAYDISKNRKKALSLGNTEVGDGPKYKGAGGIETTGKNNYRRLSERLGVDFVANPNLLRTEKYFVEAACVFWDDNKFNALADKGKITAIQNLTNRGDAKKPAFALSSRLKIYQNILDILPDTFNLNSAVSASPNEQAGTGQISSIEPTDKAADKLMLKYGSEGVRVGELQELLGRPNTGIFEGQTEAAVITFQLDHGLTADGVVGPQTWAALESKRAPTDLPGAVPVSAANKTDVVVEKEPDVTTEKPKGFLGALYQKVLAALGGGVSADTAIEKAQQAQALGLSSRAWTFIFWTVIGGLAIWIAYHFVVQKVLPWGKWLLGRIRTNQLVAGNYGADSVQVIESSKLAEYEAKGYTVVRRS